MKNYKVKKIKEVILVQVKNDMIIEKAPSPLADRICYNRG